MKQRCISRALLVAVLTGLLLLISACGAEDEVSSSPQTYTDSPSEAALDAEESAPATKETTLARSGRTTIPTPTLRPEITPLSQPSEVDGGTAAIQHIDQNSLAALDNTSAIATPIPAVPPCDERIPNSALLNIVTGSYGISGEFAPTDLVMLSDYLPYDVTAGYPSEVRQAIIEPLVQLIEAMREAGLHPQVLSGYRSYAAQAIAWDKWNRLYPERAAIISARPGHSEHQLGTVIDFGSPELPGLVGQPGIQFHTFFENTSEGQWLAEHAHEYGFTLSYTLEAFETTGFYFEPWHYRYVGTTMAELLREQEVTLTEYQLANLPPPCVP